MCGKPGLVVHDSQFQILQVTHKRILLPTTRISFQKTMQIQTVDIQNIQKGNTHASKMPPPSPQAKLMKRCGGLVEGLNLK